MSRRHAAKKREILPDIKFNSVTLAKFINKVMEQGKKALAEKIVYSALERITSKHKADGYEVFSTAMDNIKPVLEVKSVRVGGANYQVPDAVDKHRAEALAIRWILKACSKRSERSMIEKLSEELFDAFNKKGASIKSREDTHKMAEANRAFAHFNPKRNKPITSQR